MQRETPIKFENYFDSTVLQECILYVPIGTVSAYEKVDPWRNFWNIEEMDFSGINDVKAANNAPVEYYNLQGVRVANPANGLYIRRQGSTATKVLIR